MTSPNNPAEEIAKGLSEPLRTAILRARLMVSGKTRAPFTTTSETWRMLDARGLVDEGGYLSPLGHEVRDLLERTRSEK